MEQVPVLAHNSDEARGWERVFEELPAALAKGCQCKQCLTEAEMRELMIAARKEADGAQWEDAARLYGRVQELVTELANRVERRLQEEKSGDV